MLSARRGKSYFCVSSRQREAIADPDDRTSDLVALARSRSQGAPSATSSASGLEDFVKKLRAAWQIFFPERPKPMTPKEEGKQRLRMILVADR